MPPINNEVGSPVTRSVQSVRKGCGRSRVTNGSASLPGVDGRSVTARRYRDLVEALTLEQPTPMTEATRLQIRAAASMQVHVEDLTARMARGETVPAEEMTRAANGAIRALSALNRRQPSRRGGLPKSGGSVSSYLQTRATVAHVPEAAG